MEKEKVPAIFTKDSVIIEDSEGANKIYNKGRFGEFVDGKLMLSLAEALYLLERNRIEIKYRKKILDFESFLKLAIKSDPRFWTRFRVYSDIRTRGYITKTALKYGADFRVYNRGTEPGKAHAKWVLYAVNENEKFDWRKFAAMMRVAHSVRKRLLIGIVDDEGDVTYYEVRWTRP